MNDQASKPAMNVADIIRKVRKVEAKMKEIEAQYEEQVKPYKAMAEAGRAVLLKYLGDTGQRGMSTLDGGCHKKTKITFQVRDREAFKAHVITTESWEMIAWRANDAVCEDYVQAHKEPPPGAFRNAMEILTITAPAKPRLRKTKPGTLTQEEWDEISKEVDEELDALGE
jgi:hypothetical protein